MEFVFYVIAKTVSLCLGVVSFAMLGRVLMQFIVNPEENKIFLVLLMLTEPFVLPMRLLFAKLNIAQDTPFDFAFTATYLVIMVLSTFLNTYSLAI